MSRRDLKNILEIRSLVVPDRISLNLPILLLIGVFIKYPANKPIKITENPTNVPLISIMVCKSECSPMEL